MSKEDQPGFWSKAIAAAWTGAWFFLVYNATNHLATTGPTPPTWYAEWELNIPIFPWMILPYWSIDILYVGGFLLCTTRAELKILTWRTFTAVAIAGIVFMVYPLSLGFERRDEHGIWTSLYSALFSFDKPHNLFPSLHVAFAVILRWTYARHLTGWWRIGFHLWFALIGVSTVLVHQHHLIDVFGGALLGTLVMYLIDEVHVPSCGIVPTKRSRILAAAYGIGAISLVWLACELRSCWLLLLWPATSMLFAAAGYLGLGSRICQPRQAGPSIPARIILLPWLEVLTWSRRIWWRDNFPPSEVVPGVWIGRIPDIKQWEGNVIDCTCEHRRRKPLSGTHERVPMLDLVVPNATALERVAEQIQAAREEGKPVLVVCGLGLGRSALSVAAWLILSGKENSPKDALKRVKSARQGARSGTAAEGELQKLLDHR
ncbi:MAG: phosphatase PAP2/dual specificity phosphatase family protein [Limisphaerales bacterium]